MKTPQELCTTAAELISTHGHLKGAVGDYERGFCAVGALIQAIDLDGNVLKNLGQQSTDISKAFEMLKKEFELSQYGHIPGWNNAPETSAEDVILALKRAGSRD